MIKVLLVDDQAIVLQGLSMILSKEEDIRIVDSVHSGKEAVDTCNQLDIDIILMDIRMPMMNGVEATQHIKKAHPQIKIIILTTFNDDTYIFDSLRYGASGYLLKDAKPSEISSAIRTVYNGGSLIHPEIATKVLDQFKLTQTNEIIKPNKIIHDLTDREKDICHLLAEGRNNKEIAHVLFLSEGTIKNHMTHILDKLDLRDRTQLAIFSVKNRL